MLRRNYTPTPLGYAILTFFTLITLYLLTPTDSSISLLPSSWSSQSDTWTTPHRPIGKEEDELDNRPLPLLPKIYSSEFPDLKLPASLLTSPKLYPLSSRLVSFLSRPILSHSDASQANFESCPSELSDKLVNPDQYAGDGPFWRDDVDEAEIVRRRADVVRYLSEAVEKGEQVLGQEGKTGKGRGIVLTGGNQVCRFGIAGNGEKLSLMPEQDTTLRTITAIKHLRRLGVKLPIEVFHYSDELHDKQQRKEIESLGARLREAKGLEKVAGVWKVRHPFRTPPRSISDKPCHTELANQRPRSRPIFVP